jgi:hypothetical protein
MLFVFGLPLLGGSVLHPQAATAFVMGAWAGVLTAGPPLLIALWVLRIRTLGETLAPVTQLPLVLIVTALVLYYGGADIGFGPVMASSAVALWWIKRKLGLTLL